LVVTYAFRLGSRAKSFEQLLDEGKEIAKQHDAKWSREVTVVRKIFAASDLPATFRIDCPTPKGRYPVYPRMEFMRREIIGPSSQPLPLPDGAVEPKFSANDELATLPMPLLIGTAPPPVAKQRPTKTIRIPLAFVEFVDDKGNVSDRGILRWPKNNGEIGKVAAGAMILDGDLKNSLPEKKNIVAARLRVPVSQSHDQAQTQLGAVLLRSAVEKGRGIEVRSLDEISGAVVLPRQPADNPEYKPAKVFAIDVTRPLRRIAGGEAKFHGFALRVVPNRGIDDGWTVRCTIATSEAPELEIDVAQD
jgi:hypothetical protein